MKAEEFRTRFLAALPKIPAELEIDLSTFVMYSDEGCTLQHLPADDRRWLQVVGLPEAAAPFLDFSTGSAFPKGNLPAGFIYLGSTSWGDPICIESESGRIMRLDHEAGMRAFLINSSLPLFAECLCLFQEHRVKRSMSRCLAEMAALDPVALEASDFWRAEIAGDKEMS
jgi:hypothetical protein